MVWFLKTFNTYIGEISLKLGSNVTHFSKNATMFAKRYMEEWCSLCQVILQVMFACSFSLFLGNKHIAQIGSSLKCTCPKSLLHMLRETPVEM
jgi:hypothetical protein